MHLNPQKTGVVTTPGPITSAARAAFHDTGLPVVETVRDLGVDVCWGRRRQQTRQQRTRKTSLQSLRVQRLPCGPGFRAHVAAALLVSASTYGTEVDGLAPSVGRGLRRAAQKALHAGPRGRRAAEADFAFAGPSWRIDPVEASTVAAITAWARLAPCCSVGPEAVALAWDAAAGKSQIQGPVTATQTALRRLGWHASSPFHWTDRAGRRVRLEDPDELLQRAHNDFRLGEWKAVSTRRGDFTGTDGGVDEHITGHLVRDWIKRGKNKLAGGLQCILAGGSWPQERRARAGFVEDPLCPHCGQEPETTLHRWWTCPAWDKDRVKHGVMDLARAGARARFEPRCLWQNGVVPAALSHVPPPAGRCKKKTMLLSPPCLS